MGPVNRREELAAFLRAHRDALRPEDVGLPRGRSRRTPGLRREEIAMLAGVSVTWYTWLEQGRPINASVDVLEALARALRLDDAERRHLLTLADRQGTVHEPPIEDAPDALVRLITAMDPSPAYVLGPWFDFLAWNRAESLLYPMIERLQLPERNLLWVVFAEPSARALIAEWDEQARRLLAEFRAVTASVRDEPPVVDLVERLHRRQPGVRRVVERPGRRRLPDPPAPLPPPQRRRAGLRVPAADAERVARPAGGRAASRPR